MVKNEALPDGNIAENLGFCTALIMKLKTTTLIVVVMGFLCLISVIALCERSNLFWKTSPFDSRALVAAEHGSPFEWVLETCGVENAIFRILPGPPGPTVRVGGTAGRAWVGLEALQVLARNVRVGDSSVTAQIECKKGEYGLLILRADPGSRNAYWLAVNPSGEMRLFAVQAGRPKTLRSLHFTPPRVPLRVRFEAIGTRLQGWCIPEGADYDDVFPVFSHKDSRFTEGTLGIGIGCIASPLRKNELQVDFSDLAFTIGKEDYPMAVATPKGIDQTPAVPIQHGQATELP
jgi:hypothetical protein